jgi:8-amino-7-oxononanoate synthase
MHGDLAPIHEIIKLTDNQKVFLVVDEAHAGGVLGSLGKGLSFQYADKILARLVTFGKAYGTHGAIILGSEYLKDYLINFSRPLIYTTALPVKNWVRINAVIHDDLAQERNKLFDNIAYFRQTASQINYFSDPLSPIQTIRFQSREHLLKAQDAVRDSGFAVKAILTPTVPIGDECLRISIHSFNLKEEIDRLIEVLKHFC